MKYFIVIAVALLCMTSCSNSKSYSIDGIEYTVTPVDSSLNLLVETNEFSGVIFNEKTKPYRDIFSFRMLVRPTKEEKITAFTPSLEEIIKAERILKRCVEVDKIGADSMEISDGSIQELSNYSRQYFGAVNEKGQKLIWINCFAKQSAFINPTWKIEEVSVDDGGDWFFNIITNIDTDECYGFFRNSIGG
ncbi:hypothetical protein H8S95_09865 [Pontibacter sp. KCTC 32443]|uniref:hypothetical protein n=1 Tax=Pontibacter TaxID=323449 RepID=UPI00164E18A1|nr:MULTISPECIES: hypothetical protein [Pontibacter]MBC5774366.1 hypothetical protein [Pontibacter sp. KCTC 32443]